MRIALFTPYSPEIGGGSVQLRSHLAQLPDLSVEWSYLADAPVSGAHRHWLGPPISPAHFAWDLPATRGLRPCPSKVHLTIGHIGKLYHPGPFRQFILACRDYAANQKRTLKIVRIGACTEMDKVASENLALFESHGELLETDAFPLLSTCDFVYAMYPPGFRFQGFRRTSLPIKLSTYIQAQRPIFAHTPPDSGLAKLVSKHRVGTVCSSNRQSDIQDAVRTLLDLQITGENFDAIRDDLMGPQQLHQLRNALVRSVSGGNLQ